MRSFEVNMGVLNGFCVCKLLELSYEVKKTTLNVTNNGEMLLFWNGAD